MKKILLGSALSTALLLAACGGEIEDDTTIEETDTDTAETTTKESEDENSEIENEEKGTRSNPHNLGEVSTLEIMDMDESGNEIQGKVEVTIDNVMRGQEAVDYLNSGYSTINKPDNENLEWVVFDLKVDFLEFDDPDTPIYIGEDVSVFDKNGSQVNQDTFVFVLDEDKFPSGELYSGGTAEGSIVLKAPKDEEFSLVYNDYINESVFYKVPVQE